MDNALCMCVPDIEASAEVASRNRHIGKTDAEKGLREGKHAVLAVWGRWIN